MGGNISEHEIKLSILDWLALQRKCVAWIADSVGIFDPVKKIYRKRHGKHARKGVSDILVCWRGRLVCIECKSDTGRVSPDQQIFMYDIRRAGGVAFIARSLDDVLSHFKTEGLLQ